MANHKLSTLKAFATSSDIFARKEREFNANLRRAVDAGWTYEALANYSGRDPGWLRDRCEGLSEGYPESDE